MGARMHACIAAFSSGVPVVPMAYSRKFEGLFGSLGYDRTVDCTADSAERSWRILAAYEARVALAAEAPGHWRWGWKSWPPTKPRLVTCWTGWRRRNRADRSSICETGFLAMPRIKTAK